jgi:hypothetical protein
MKSTALAGLAAATILAAAGAAHAESWQCSAQAQAPNGAVMSVDETVSDSGAVSDVSARWQPPAEKDGFPALNIVYAPDANGLGAPTAVLVMHLVSADPLPRSPEASMAIHGESGAVWMRPWGLYAHNMRQLGAVPKGAQQVGFFGAVPMAFRGDGKEPALNQGLLDAIPTTPQLRVTIDGSLGERLGERTFQLSDTAARDTMYRQVSADLEAAAKDPRRHCEAAKS